ncbi:MAG: radical SAM protein [Acidobacteriaceae bacterium]
MAVFLINPSDHSFGTAVITPRWLYVLAAATPVSFGDPVIVDETLEALVPSSIQSGDFVGIGIHTGNALRGYAVGRLARERGAWVVFGGIHATLYPEEALERGCAHSVVKGDGDVVWCEVLRACVQGTPNKIYEGGKIEADQFVPARWDLLPPDKYMWASVQTVRGCPKHCSFCSVWRTDGQRPRQRSFESVIGEIVQLRRKGFRYIALADDNFYPVTLTDLRLAREQKNYPKLAELEQIRSDKFALMAELAKLPKNMVFFTQITMESAEDPDYLDAMRKANIKGALVGVESVTPEGLKSVFKEFNVSGEGLVKQLQTFRAHGLNMLGSFIFGLPSDTPASFKATSDLALRAGLAFAQFVMLTPFPGTVDFLRWEKEQEKTPVYVEGIPVTRYWLIPAAIRPKMFMPHALMSSQEISDHTQGVWDRFYSLSSVWKRSSCAPTLRARVAFVFLSKLYRKMYAGTGISTDSARRKKANSGARWLSRYTRKFFISEPMPDLAMPVWTNTAVRSPATGLTQFPVLE